MKSYSFYDAGTGLFRAGHMVMSEAALKDNTPPGHAAIEGVHDHRNRRVDLKTARVVDWQPPAPPGDALTAWTWDTASRMWCAAPTELAQRQAARAQLIRQIEAAERAQQRPLRLLALDPADSVARARLLALEQDIAVLRAELPAPHLPDPPA